MAAPSLQPKPFRALALLRKSTNAQDNKRQRADIERLKKKFGIEIVETVELDGVSGRKVLKDERFQKILDDMPNRRDVDGLALSAIDRFFRTDKYGDTGIFQPLADNRKKIWSALEGEVEPWTDEGFNTCMTAALKSGAEWRELRRRTCDAKVELAEAGILPHGNAWFGVDIVGRKNTGVMREGKAVINEAEAEIVNEVFTRVAANTEATYAIAADLNKRGILSKGHNGKPPAQWSRTTILQMIKNTSYICKHVWKGITIRVDRIVSDELFYAANAALKGRKKKWVGRPAKAGLLAKFLECEECEHTIGRVKNVYRCAHVTNKPPFKRLCNAPGFSVAVADQVAFLAIWAMLNNPALLLEMGYAHYAGQMDPNEELVRDLEARLKQLQQKDRNFTKNMEDAASDEEHAEQRAKRTAGRSEIASLELQIRNARKVVNLPPLAILEANVNKITAGPTPSTYDRQRSILEGLEELRIVYGKSGMVITGKVPVSDMAAADGGVSTGRKCYRRVHADSNYVQSIPFILNVELPPAPPKMTRAVALKIWEARRKNGTVSAKQKERVA